LRRDIVIFYLLIGLILNVNAQSAFQNNGNMQVHAGGEIGFHTNLVNNGEFDKNLGFIGFYNLDEALTISGANKPIFNNVEIAVLDDLYLETSVGVSNNLSFITGKVVTPRDDLSVTLDFVDYFVYSGEGDNNFVDGYATTTNNNAFTFPIGDANALRPMMLPEQAANSTYSGAYFKENPNDFSFDTSIKQDFLGGISEEEFWDLKGSVATQIVLTWDANSDIESLTSEFESIRVVGWKKESNKWVDLGAENILGDLYSGSVQSANFIPNEFEIITIGVDLTGVLGRQSCDNNYVFTPNGDGINDYFVIEGLELRPNNTVKILNRWGALVYSKHGYANTWNGVSENNWTINKGGVLPAGTYYYILELHDEGTVCLGYIYLGA
jgi:gliding motility-associated-like protein